MSWRSHQAQFLSECETLAQRQNGARHFVASVTPGGGKSALPIIAAAKLIPAIADRICWLVPRSALQQQGQEAFRSPYFRSLLKHRMYVSGQLGQGFGLVATYQALLSDGVNAFASAFDQHRYILVLDEPHHAAAGTRWAEVLRPLVERSAVLIQMSGTFQRHDDRAVAFLPYRRDDVAGGQVFDPDYAQEQGAIVISYSRQDALKEKAIIPLEVRWFDLSATWIEDDEQQSLFSLAEVDDEQEAKESLYIALKAGAASEILSTCYQDWAEYRRFNCRSKLLVVAASIDGAKAFKADLEALGAKRVGIAVSSSSSQAHRNIDLFKSQASNRIDILVSVGMAYEGLDVPSITHVACLTNIRSIPWIEQMATRATRIDRGENALPYGEQVAYLYCPEDLLMKRCVEGIIEEQQAFAHSFYVVDDDGDEADEGLGGGSLPDIDSVETSFEVLSSAANLTGLSDLEGGQLTPEEVSALPALARITGTPREQLVMLRVGIIKGQLKAHAPMIAAMRSDPVLQPIPLPTPETVPVPRSQQELRSVVHTLTKQVDGIRGYPPGTTNSFVLKEFRKPRAQMNVDELARVETWLRSRLGGQAVSRMGTAEKI